MFSSTTNSRLYKEVNGRRQPFLAIFFLSYFYLASFWKCCRSAGDKGTLLHGHSQLTANGSAKGLLLSAIQ